MKKILISLLFLVSCGEQSSNRISEPTPNPGEVIQSSSLTGYIDSFEQRYNVPVNYTVDFDSVDSTGGQSSGGTTVGVCRVWTSGKREVFINKEWWESQQRIPSQDLNDNINKVNVENNQFNSGLFSYNYGGVSQRKNLLLRFTVKGLSISSSNLISSNSQNISIIPTNSSFSTSGNSCISDAHGNTCFFMVKFNESENLELGNHSYDITLGDRVINFNATITEPSINPYDGELARKILIYHELGHCSFDREHDCRTDSRSDSGVSCSNGNYHVANENNAPKSIMYPTINPIVHHYKSNENKMNYYEDELEENREDYSAMAFQYQLEKNEINRFKRNTSLVKKDTGDCVQFMD